MSSSDPLAGGRRSRVVALINPVLHCRSTCAELIERGINLVGIVEAQTKTTGLPLATIRRLLKRQGLTATASQVAARVAYLALNRKTDRSIYRELFDREQIESTLSAWRGVTISCRSYGEDSAIAAIDALQPDILVVHSQSWVDRKVRELARKGLVIGGHPGMTPDYRGSHSPFWALLNGEPEKVGWTAFHLDKGVDTGDVIVQGRLTIENGDSYMSLNWRGMKQIAAALGDAILEFDRSGTISRSPHRQIPPNSEFGLPGIRQYLTYRRQQKLAR